MKSLNVPSSNQPVSNIGYSENFSTPGKLPDDVCNYVRVKNVGEEIGHIRLHGSQDDGMAFSPGETEYLYINEGECIEIVDGEFNVMH